MLCDLTGTDLKVSDICLGTVAYGGDLEETAACRQMEEFLELGGNFLDTAHVYNDWIPGERARSEHVIGRFLKRTGKRHEVVISTKGAHPQLDAMSVSRVRPECIRKDLEESLEALQTDYIDLYFLHRDNTDMPVEEILSVLEEARRQGKVRWYGCSNWTLPRMLEADRAAEKLGFAGFVCDQLMWSLADINRSGVGDRTLVMMTEEIYDYHRQSKKNVMAYTSAAHGYLSKRDRGTATSPALRAQYENAQNEQILELLREYHMPVSECSFAYFAHRGFTAIPIASFRTREQMEEAMRSRALEIPPELLAQIEAVKKHSIF